MDYLNSKLPVRNGKIFISILPFSSLSHPHLLSCALLFLVVVCACGLEPGEEEVREKLIYRGWSALSHTGSSHTKLHLDGLAFCSIGYANLTQHFLHMPVKKKKREREHTRRISLHPFQQVTAPAREEV